MSNVEMFQLLAAKAFAILYESFPVYEEITPEDLAKAVYPDDVERARIVAGHSLTWLCEAGYLMRAVTGAKFRFVLTPKGFEILNASPFPKPEANKATAMPETRKQNLGERFVAAVADAGTEELKSLTKQVLEWGVSLAITGIKAYHGNP